MSKRSLRARQRSCADCNLAGRDLQDRDLKRARLDRADLKEANLTGDEPVPRHAGTSELAGARLTDANLNLVDAKWADLAGATRGRPALRGRPLRRQSGRRPTCRAHGSAGRASTRLTCRARGCARRPARRRLAGARSGADLRGVKLNGQNLREIISRHRFHHGRHDRGGSHRRRPQGREPRRRRPVGANLHAADLRGANLEGANLTNAILSDARTEGATSTPPSCPTGGATSEPRNSDALDAAAARNPAIAPSTGRDTRAVTSEDQNDKSALLLQRSRRSCSLRLRARSCSVART